MDCSYQLCISVYPTKNNDILKSGDPGGHSLQIISHLLNASFRVFIEQVVVFAVAVFCKEYSDILEEWYKN